MQLAPHLQAIRPLRARGVALHGCSALKARRQRPRLPVQATMWRFCGENYNPGTAALTPRHIGRNDHLLHGDGWEILSISLLLFRQQLDRPRFGGSLGCALGCLLVERELPYSKSTPLAQELCVYPLTNSVPPLLSARPTSDLSFSSSAKWTTNPHARSSGTSRCAPVAGS